MGRYALPILLLIISIGSFVVLTNPLYGDIKVLMEEDASYSNALSNSLELQKVRDVLIEKYNQFPAKDIKRLEGMIPASVDNIKLAIEIQKIGEEKGLSVESVQYDPKENETQSKDLLGREAATTNDDFEVFELEIIAKGTYEQFINFLEGIEQNLRIVDVSKVEFTSGNAVLNTNIYTYNITIKTYRLRD